MEKYEYLMSQAVTIQSMARMWIAQKERDKLFIQHIKAQAKVLKKQKKQKKLDNAARMIQRHLRGSYIRHRYAPVLEKMKDKTHLLDKIEKIKKKIAKAKKQREKELEKAKQGVNIEHSKGIWEATQSGYHVQLSEEGKRVEYLQNEHRQLQISVRSAAGMLKPLNKNFDTLMDENKQLRDEFQEVHKRNERAKKANKELIDKREAAEKKVEELKKEFAELNARFAPAASGRVDFQNGLHDLLQLIQARCADDALVDEVMDMGRGVYNDAGKLQAEAVAKHETNLLASPENVQRRLGVRPGTGKTPPSLQRSKAPVLNRSLGDLGKILGDIGALDDSPPESNKKSRLHSSLGDLGSRNHQDDKSTAANNKKKGRRKKL
jgi:chromosome segregation ATPase